jgi:hypothetical protein
MSDAADDAATVTRIPLLKYFFNTTVLVGGYNMWPVVILCDWPSCNSPIALGINGVAYFLVFMDSRSGQWDLAIHCLVAT